MTSNVTLDAESSRGESKSRGDWQPSTQWEPPAPRELQAQISSYKVLELIGRGGMGAVYKGWQVHLERYVAIKILPPNLEADEFQFAELFKREAKTMAKFQRPGIIAVFDAGETPGGLLYIVMEYVEGTDVARMVKSQGRLPSEHALAITAHVCDALQYAHSHGVVHHDIKPANIMVNMQGEVKVADFGLAKASEVAQQGLAKSVLTMGTPAYTAPEALITGLSADHRADLYSVGVMLHNMLTGEIPQGRFLLPSGKEGIDPRFDDIIARAMQTEREHRYQSALEIRQDLDRILTPIPERRRPPGSTTQIQQSVPRKATARGPSIGGKPGPLTGAEATSAGPEDRGAGVESRSREYAPRKAKLGILSVIPAIIAGVAIVAICGVPLWPRAVVTSPQDATKERPFINSLGMKFVPAPGTDVLFCIHDTRKGDYRKYVEAKTGKAALWKNLQFKGATVCGGEDHPVVNVSWDDAKEFCDWLSGKESRTYRLPTDHEWSVAVGIGDQEDPLANPASMSGAVRNVYPWGTEWPPPAGAGNFADRTLKEQVPSWGKGVIEGYNDGYATTSPVMSFRPNNFGLYDMAGNVWQWCEDKISSKDERRVLRGGAWHDLDRDQLLSSHRYERAPASRGNDCGFRVVLER